MIYKKAIFFKDGKCVIVTDKEAEAVKERLLSGDKFFEVAGNFISADNLARIGTHEMTAENQRMEQSSLETTLLTAGRNGEVKKLRDMRKQIAMRNVRQEKEEILGLPMSADQEEAGEAMFYLDAYGQKIYS